MFNRIERFNNTMFETSDLGIAAYLMVNDFTLVNATKERTVRFLFVFEDPKGTAKSFAIKFVSSCCCKFDGHVKNLKKLIN